MRAEDTSEDWRKILMSGKIPFRKIFVVTNFSINFTFHFTERCSYNASYDNTIQFSSRFKSLIDIQTYFSKFCYSPNRRELTRSFV